MQRRAFVTCNRGKTSNRDTIVGSGILGRAEEWTKSLRGRGLALTFVKTVKERPVQPRRVVEPGMGHCHRVGRRTQLALSSRRTLLKVLKVVFPRVKAREYF